MLLVSRLIDFTDPFPNHWADFEGGDNFNARFSIRGNVAKGDEIIVRLRSGKHGYYSLYSVLRDFTGVADWKASGCLVDVQDPHTSIISPNPIPAPKIKGLLCSENGRVQPDAGKLAPLQSGFTDSTSDFWKILCRDEARSSRTDRIRSAGYLRLG